MTIKRAPNGYHKPHDWKELMFDDEFHTLFCVGGLLNLKEKQACVLEICSRESGYSEADMMKFISSTARHYQQHRWSCEYGTHKLGFRSSLWDALLDLLRASAWRELDDPMRFDRWAREWTEEEPWSCDEEHGFQEQRNFNSPMTEEETNQLITDLTAQ
tara:strand:+ start:168 stop:644 length:477 start_codon:yes stop_codon:yes gene_type:complete